MKVKVLFIHLLLLLAVISAADSSSAETVSLSSLDLRLMTTGWSDAKADLGVAGKPISIAGKTFSGGVGTHAASYFRVKLDGKTRRFTAQVGVDDGAGGQGSVEFMVLGDGKPLWKSGVMVGGQPPLPVDVNLTGVKTPGLVGDGRE